ncbi:hypothetical protein B0H13DRAFT_2683985 [Mycena leptocephala]|nr:hypothetical protein B0H13DRAFT_2683985 [Mycena leptocephala]
MKMDSLQRSFPDRSRSPLNRRTLKTERTSKTSSGAQRRAESVINTERRQEHGQWHSLDNENGQLGEIVPRPQPQPAQQAHTEDGEDLEDFVWRTKAGRYNSHIKANGTHSTMKMDSLERSFPDRSRSPLYRRTLKTERASKTSSGAPRQAESVINTERRQEHAWRDRSPRSRSPLYRRTLKTERTSKTSSGALRQAESVINTERRQEYGQWHSLDNENGQLAEIVPRPQPQPAQQAHTEDGEDLEDFVWRTKAGRYNSHIEANGTHSTMKMDSLQRSSPPQPQPALQAHTEDGEDLEDFVWRAKAGRVGHQYRTSSGARLQRSFPDRSRSPLNRRTPKTERTSKTSSGAPRQAESVINTERRQEHAWRDRSPRSRSPLYRRTLKTERTSKTSSGAPRQAESVINTERRQEYGESVVNYNQISIYNSHIEANGTHSTMKMDSLERSFPPQPQPAQQAHTEDGEDLEDFVWRTKAGRVGHEDRTSSGTR